MLNNIDTPLPASLEVLIQARIDALPSDLKQVIQVAAVLGAPFDVDILNAVCNSPDIDAALKSLTSRQFVCKANVDKRWTFSHPLIEGVAYKSILDIKRYHQVVAGILEARWVGSESEHAEVLAYHLIRADQNARALSYLITAGEGAADRFENEKAVNYFEQAAQVLSTLPGTTDLIRWRLATGLGDVYREMGRLSDSMAALHDGIASLETVHLNPTLHAGLYRRMGDTTRKQGDYQTADSYFKAAILIIGRPETAELQIELARTLTGSAWAQFHQGLFGKARETAERGLVYAEVAESVVDLAALENLLGGISYSQSDWASASQHTQRAMTLREQMGYTRGVASTLANLGVLAILLGDWQKAQKFFKRSLSMRMDMDDVEGLALVHNNLGMLLRDQGDLDQAEKHFRNSLHASKPFAHSYHTANATLGLAYVFFLKNNPTSARQFLSQALQLTEEIGASDVLTEAHRVQVEMLIAEGNLKPALEAAQTTLEGAQKNGNRNHQASLWRLISTIELAQGHIESANNALEQAQEILSSITDVLELGRTHAQAARIAMTVGNRAAVDTHLQTAKGAFMKLGAELDLARIQKLSEYRNIAQG